MNKNSRVTLALLGLNQVYASKLQVVHPSELKKAFLSRIDGEMEEGVIKSSLGNFGHFNYGTTLKGRLHYPLQN